MPYSLKYKQYGAYAILIEWPNRIDASIFFDIMGFKVEIESQPNKKIKAVISAYNSIVVTYFIFEELEFKKEIKQLKAYYSKKQLLKQEQRRVWQIPVCYDLSFGIDLERLSKDKKISIEEIIQRHYAQQYLVYFKGFLPGFMYLGGLDSVLFQPRKNKPRLKIEKGAVAIGGEQTGVYPIESPGGWNIIGNSPINFFDINKKKPCFVNNGDYIQFYSINKKAHQDIKILVDKEVYQLEYKEI